MGDRTKNLLLGGAALLGSALCGWYIYEKCHTEKVSQISTGLLIQIMKEEEREFYPILKVLAEFSKEYWKQAKEKNISLSLEAIPEMITKEYPLIHEKMRDVSKNILKKYRVSEKEVEEAMLLSFQEDPEFQNVISKKKAELENAYMGIAPKLASKIPDFLTPEKALGIFYMLATQGSQYMVEEIVSVSQDPSFLASEDPIPFGLWGDFRVQLRLFEKKRKILAEEGLDAFEEAPERILDTAIARYAAGSPAYRKQLKNIEFIREEKDKWVHRPTKLLVQNADLESK